jgi:hypothetical protein
VDRPGNRSDDALRVMTRLALARAQMEWPKVQFEEESDEDQDFVLFKTDDLLMADEERLKASGVAAIEQNLPTLLGA